MFLWIVWHENIKNFENILRFLQTVVYFRCNNLRKRYSKIYGDNNFSLNFVSPERNIYQTDRLN